eukprot:10331357-Alexandrium_andersonii.AAC.1
MEADLNRLPSGPRTVKVVQWGGSLFPIHETARRKYRLADGARDIEHLGSASADQMGKRPAVAERGFG